VSAWSGEATAATLQDGARAQSHRRGHMHFCILTLSLEQSGTAGISNLSDRFKCPPTKRLPAKIRPGTLHRDIVQLSLSLSLSDYVLCITHDWPLRYRIHLPPDPALDYSLKVGSVRYPAAPDVDAHIKSMTNTGNSSAKRFPSKIHQYWSLGKILACSAAPLQILHGVEAIASRDLLRWSQSSCLRQAHEVE
jgi:hypothetical protein